jgi:hypothetical protein
MVLSYYVMMAALKMANKRRNMVGQPHWRCNVLTNSCICWNNRSVKLKMDGTEHCKQILPLQTFFLDKIFSADV